MSGERKHYIQVTYNGVDAYKMIDPYMSQFTYIDSVDESDTISLSLTDRDLRWVASWIPQKGDVILPSIILENWNYLSEKMTFLCGSFVVDDFSFTGPPAEGSINGVSAPVSTSFKESDNTKTWTHTNLRVIASEIAGKYGLELRYDIKKDIPIAKIEQSRQTDADFLRQLCQKYGLGIKVYSNRLVIWDYREYFALPPTIVLTPDQVSKWTYKSTMQGTYTGARISYTVPKSKKTVDVIVGTEERLYKANQKADSEADARLIGEGALISANRKAVTMQIMLPPKLSLAATNTVQISGFGNMDGKYFIEKVTHSMTKKNYTMQLNLS